MAEDIRRFRINDSDSLVLPAKRDAFVNLQSWLNQIADELALADKTRKHLLIVADEIFTNIANYGYPFGDGTAEVPVDFNMATSEIVITFSDNGIAYNPLQVPPPDFDSPLADREIGGLGVFVVKKLMDSVEYERREDRNVLILKKIITN